MWQHINLTSTSVSSAQPLNEDASPESAIYSLVNALNQSKEKISIFEDRHSWLHTGANSEGFNIDQLRETSLLQRNVVSVIATTTEDPAITDSLTASIEKNAQFLLDIQNSIGLPSGKKELSQAVQVMFNSITRGGFLSSSGVANEDLFQLALIDCMINHEQYRLPFEVIETANTMLDRIGSASHSNAGEELIDITNLLNYLWNFLASGVNAGRIPGNSMVRHAMERIAGQWPLPTSLPQDVRDWFQPYNYNSVSSDGWINNDLQHLSPMLRISIYGMTFKQITDEADRQIILTGSKAEIDRLLTDTVGKDALTLLTSSGKWNNPGTSLPSGASQSLSYIGPVDASFFTELVTNCAKTALTKEDIKEVNNIGDQVKMLMQTLKYWLTTLRDEQLSIARNIG